MSILLRQTLHRALWAVCAAAALCVLPAHAADCQLGCTAGDCSVACAGPACQVRDLDGHAVALDNKTLKSVQACDLLQAKSGQLELRYRHKGRWFSPPGGVPEGIELKTVFAQYPADPCGVPSPTCLQQRMGGMVAAIGGHGIDSKESQPAGQGNPCLLGLPCGQVLPPPAVWRFRLADAALSGSWSVTLARGAPAAGQAAQAAGRVDKGLCSIDGNWFVPGAQYVYRLADDAGRMLASGEFSVLSRTARETLDKLVQRRIAAGMSEGLAWSDTLGANNLDWDAYQRALAPGEAP